MPLSFTSIALMPIITAVAALPVDPLAKFNGTDAAPTYKQCYWDRSHDWDNPNACYVEGEVLPLPYPDGFRTAFAYETLIRQVGFNGNFVATIMDDCQKTGLRKCEKTHQFERGNQCCWDSSGGRDGKPPNACYVPISDDPDIEYSPDGYSKGRATTWHPDANMDDCRGAYRETGGATGSACTRVLAWYGDMHSISETTT